LKQLIGIKKALIYIKKAAFTVYQYSLTGEQKKHRHSLDITNQGNLPKNEQFLWLPVKRGVFW